MTFEIKYNFIKVYFQGVYTFSMLWSKTLLLWFMIQKLKSTAIFHLWLNIKNK